MADFLSAYRAVVEGHEGAYSNDPADLGGETYKGVARVANPNWGGWPNIDRAKADRSFPANLEADVELQAMVRAVYKTRYWDPLWLDAVPSQAVATELFDQSVNLGVGKAAEHLQLALNALNREGRMYADLVVDGRCGPLTVRTLAVLLGAGDERHLVRALNALQGAHYMALARKSPRQERFLRGWLRRAVAA